MKFYLNNNQVETEVQVEVAPKINETLDDTLDSASFVLKANNVKEPYAPMQEFRVEFQNTANDILYFYIISDEVKLYSANPLTYTHTLNCIQKTRKLSKHLVRNTVFSQPATKYKESFFSLMEILSSPISTDPETTANLVTTNYTNQGYHLSKLNLDNKEKVKDVYLEIDLQCAYKEATIDTTATFEETNTIQEMRTKCNVGDTKLTEEDIYLNYTLNGTTHREILNYPTHTIDISWNKKIKFDRAKQLLEQGATDLYLSTNLSGSNYTKYIRVDNYGLEPENNKCPSVIFIQMKLVAETYYYTAYELLDLLIKRQQQISDSGYKAKLFSLPTSGELYDLLNNTIAPNFTFTQCTMFECVAEIFNLFDATFTMDNNGVLGIEYLNERNQGVVAKDFSSLELDIKEDDFNNGYVSYYQDARVERQFPSSNDFANVRSSDLGVPAQSDHHFIVDKPIQSVLKCGLKCTKIEAPRLYPTGGSVICEGTFTLDLTRFIIEQSIWSTLDATDTIDVKYIRQNNTAYYTSGSDKIDLGFTQQTRYGLTIYPIDSAVFSALKRMAGYNNTAATSFTTLQVIEPAEHDWKNYYMQLSYITTIDGRTEIQSIDKKYDGEQLVTQNNGSVDLNKMGLNMLGVSLRQGQPTLTATHQISEWSDRIKKGQQYISNGVVWVANICSYTLLDINNIQGTITFVRNFNGLARRVKLNREKRFSNISKSLTEKSEDNIIQFAYYSSEQIDYTPDLGGYFISRNLLGSGLLGAFNIGQDTITYAQLTTYSNNTKIVDCYFPMVKYSAGNCLCFEMSFDSPITAGNKTLNEQSGWFGTTQYFTSAVKYADSNGFVDKVDIQFATSTFTFDENFPEITNPLTTPNIDNLEVYKQPNEILALNYEIAFIPQEANKLRDFVGQEWLKNNNLILENKIVKKFYLYYTTTSDFKYSILDTKGEMESGETRQEITSVETENGSNDNLLVKFNHASLSAVKTWAICDEDGNIYYATNKNTASGTQKIVYFQLQGSRL